jgi:hypothetical protein
MLGSRRFATTVIVAWAALLVVWVIPFEFYGLPSENIKTIIYEELFFRLVYGLVALSTIACIVPRIPAAVRRAKRRPSQDSLPRISASHRAEASGPWNPEKARSVLLSMGYRHIVTSEGWAWGVRNRWSPIGSVAFHVSLLLLMLSATLMLLPGSRFAASAVVAEGEPFDSTTAVYSDRSTPDVEPPEIVFTVKSIAPRFHEDILLFTQLDSVLTDELGNQKHMSLAAPWIPNATTLVAIEDFGYTLTVTGSGAETETANTQVYKLKVFPSSMSDSFERDVGSARYRFDIRVFGDYVDRAGTPGTRSFNLDDPRVEVSVARILSSGGSTEVLPARLIKPGESIEIREDSVTIEKVGYYGVYRLTRNLAAPFLFAAVLLLCAGSAARLVFPRREALMVSEGDVVLIAVNDETYRTSQRALDALRAAWEDAK